MIARFVFLGTQVYATPKSGFYRTAAGRRWGIRGFGDCVRVIATSALDSATAFAVADPSATAGGSVTARRTAESIRVAAVGI